MHGNIHCALEETVANDWATAAPSRPIQADEALSLTKVVKPTTALAIAHLRCFVGVLRGPQVLLALITKALQEPLWAALLIDDLIGLQKVVAPCIDDLPPPEHDLTQWCHLVLT